MDVSKSKNKRYVILTKKVMMHLKKVAVFLYAKKNVNIQGLKIHCDTYNLSLKHPAFFLTRVLYTLDILFSSNHNINKSLFGLCFWALDSLNERYQ